MEDLAAVIKEVELLKKQVAFLLEQNTVLIARFSSKIGVPVQPAPPVKNTLATGAIESTPEELLAKFKEFAVTNDIALAISMKKVTGVDVAVLLGFKTSCGSCFEVLRALQNEKLSKDTFATIDPTSIYYDKIVKAYGIKGSPFLLVIHNGIALPPVIGWDVVTIVKKLLTDPDLSATS